MPAPAPTDPPRPATPSRVAAEVFLHLCATRWPRLRPVAPLTGGSNDIWSATDTGGPGDVVVKVYTDTHEDPHQVRAQEAASLAVWGHTGAVPRLLATGAAPHPYLVTALAPGRTLAPVGAADRTGQVAARVRLLHDASSPDAGDWPDFFTGWVGQTPARLTAAGGTDAAETAAAADRALTALAAEPTVLIHGDVAPWNVLDDDAGALTLLDPLARTGPAAFDLARWCVTAALSRVWADGLLGEPDELLKELSRLARMAQEAYADTLAVREAVVLELLNRASFVDWRWPDGYAAVLTSIALELTGDGAHNGYPCRSSHGFVTL